MSTQIVTGDAVVLDLRPARVPTRSIGALVDVAITFGLLWLGEQLLDRFDSSMAGNAAAATAVSLVALFGYRIGCETALGGRTLGHLAMGLRVVRDDGGPAGFRHSLIRGLAFWLVDFTPWTGFVLGLVTSGLHPQGKRVGDLLAGTLVIRTRAPRATQPIAEVTATGAAWAAAAELSRVTDEQVAAARYALKRSKGLRDWPRHLLLHQLGAQLAAVVSPQPPPTLPVEEFLVAVVAEHSRRGTARRRGLGVDVPTAWR